MSPIVAWFVEQIRELGMTHEVAVPFVSSALARRIITPAEARAIHDTPRARALRLVR